MLDPSTLGAAYVARLQAISALVTLMGGTTGNIQQYDDNYPTVVDYLKAVREMTTPGILVAHQETGPGKLASMEVWRHRYTAVVKPNGKISDVWALLVNGVPAGGDGLKMLSTAVHPSVFRMDIPILKRQFLPISEVAVLDYYEVTITFIERGDS